MEYQLDLRVYRCPLPLLMTKKALSTLPKKATLHLRLNTEISEGDFAQLAKKLNLQMTVLDCGDKSIQITLKKGLSSAKCELSS